nr:hypothetical protein [Vallitaleaceae bacterium]
WTETVSATDDVDGDITVNVVATYFESDGSTSIADLAAAKTYIDDATVNTTFVINYNVSDAASNPATEKVVTITVTPAPDTTAPVITAADETVAFADLAAWTETVSATDDVDGDITVNVVATYFESDGSTSIADLAASKTYIDDATVNKTFVINYNVSDAASNPATEKVVTITVTP